MSFPNGNYVCTRCNVTFGDHPYQVAPLKVVCCCLDGHEAHVQVNEFPEFRFSQGKRFEASTGSRFILNQYT